jgi:hypothetical protein
MDKQGVLEHLAEARAALLAAIGGLAEADMTALPVAGEWMIKDILAHVSGWAAWEHEEEHATQIRVWRQVTRK